VRARSNSATRAAKARASSRSWSLLSMMSMMRAILRSISASSRACWRPALARSAARRAVGINGLGDDLWRPGGAPVGRSSASTSCAEATRGTTCRGLLNTPVAILAARRRRCGPLSAEQTQGVPQGASGFFRAATILSWGLSVSRVARFKMLDNLRDKDTCSLAMASSIPMPIYRPKITEGHFRRWID